MQIIAELWRPEGHQTKPILIWERKGNHVMVIMGSGITCGCIRLMATELCKMHMVAIFQIIG